MIPEDGFSQKKEIAEIKISKKSKAACHQFITKYLLWALVNLTLVPKQAACGQLKDQLLLGRWRDSARRILSLGLGAPWWYPDPIYTCLSLWSSK